MQEKEQLQTPNKKFNGQIYRNEHFSLLVYRKEHSPSLTGAGAGACARTAGKALVNTNAATAIATPMLARDTAMDLAAAQPRCKSAERTDLKRTRRCSNSTARERGRGRVCVCVCV